MAAIAITAANVLQGGPVVNGLAGETITAGQVVRLVDGKMYVASNNSAVNAAAYGVALNGASANQPVAVQTSGPITIGGTVAVGKHYALGTSGGIIPVDDIAGSEYSTYIGVGLSTTVLQLAISTSGVQAAGAVT